MQVAKALLDAAAATPSRPQVPSVSHHAISGAEQISQLLQFREDGLTAEIGLAMAKAMKGASNAGIVLVKHTVPSYGRAAVSVWRQQA